MKTVLVWKDDYRTCTISSAKQELFYKLVEVVVEDQKKMDFIYFIEIKK